MADRTQQDADLPPAGRPHGDPPGDQSRHATWTGDCRADELAAIQRRRADATQASLVGLAISGGGIRSATLALGILETLRRSKILGRVDYLSTVSGGGYIGAWLTGNCLRTPGWLTPDEGRIDRWRESISHLRRYSNYLSPTVGFFSADTWSMATIWLRNTLLIQTTVILAIAVLLMLPRPLFEIFEHWPQVGQLRWLTVALFIFGVVGIAGNLWRLTADRDLPILKAKWWLKGIGMALVFGVAAWGVATLRGFDPFGTGEVDYTSAVPVAGLLLIGGLFLLPLGVRLAALGDPVESAPTQINYDQGWVQRVVIIPLMLVGFLVAAILWGESNGLASGGHLAGLDTYGEAFTTAWKYWPFPLSVVFVSMWLLSFFGFRGTGWRTFLRSMFPALVAVGVLHALLSAVMVLLHPWTMLASGDGAWRAFVWGPPMVALSFVTTIVVLIGMMGRQSTDGVREWWSRLGAWLGIYATGWMVISVVALYGPEFVAWAFTSHFWESLTVSGGWLATIVGGLVGGNSGATGGEERGKSVATQFKEVLAAVAPFLFIAGLLIGVACTLDYAMRANTTHDWKAVASSLVPAAGVTAASQVSDGGTADPASQSVAMRALDWLRQLLGAESDFRHLAHGEFLAVAIVILLGCLAALALMAWRVDINEFSLNAFYRNRLVRCYLGATRPPRERTPQNFTGFDPDDDILLGDLITDTAAPRGPLHIVNCALNLGGSSDLALHTRHSATFILSPLFCGSSYESRDQSGVGKALGYVKTSAYGGHSSAPTLGQAISVSGAAASPNMGSHTSPVVAFLLTVFNVRLGWWFPNPARTDTAVASPRFNLRYLFAELLGGANDKSPFVMISDGGHFENLAAYELIRRRLPVVIISDGECDPTLSFEGLGTLIRMCNVDFKCRISINVERIRTAGTSKWSPKRFAVGRIHYDDGTRGVLIYLKASMTGHEDTPVLQYKSSHPTFPHESTGDQFYAEDQFESYRRLGEEVSSDVFGTFGGGGQEPDVVVWAEGLLEQYEAEIAAFHRGGRTAADRHELPATVATAS